MNKIILDANVLYSSILRGLFLWMSSRGLFQISWSREIWDEVFRNYSRDPKKEEIFRQDIERVIWRNFSDSMKELSSDFTPVGLPDRNDEHVVALARQEKAGNIATFNLKDFPEGILQELSIRCEHPDTFLVEAYEAQKNETVDSIRDHLQALSKTRMRKAEYIHRLKRAGVEKFAAKLEEADAKNELFAEIWS